MLSSLLVKHSRLGDVPGPVEFPEEVGVAHLEPVGSGADSTKESNAMTRDITPAGLPATGAVDEAFAEVRASFDRFCLAAGIEALGTMMEADVTTACGPRHGRTRRGGRTVGAERGDGSASTAAR